MGTGTDGGTATAVAKRKVGSTGTEVTVLGFGGLQVGDYWVKMPQEVAYQTIAHAYQSGIRYFDTAPHYGTGLSEHRLGHQLREYPRDSYVVSTKVGRYLVPADADEVARTDRRGLPFKGVYDLSYDATMRAFDQSLQRLGLDRIDLLFIHDLDPYQHGDQYDVRFKEALEGCYPALEKLRGEKVVRGIGAGINTHEACVRLIEATDLDCVMVAGRYTLLEQKPAEDLLPLAQRRNVSLVMGAPFNTGILATGAVAGALYNNKPPPPAILEQVMQIEAVCKRHGIPIAAAALQFPLGHAAVASVVPGMGGLADVDRNLMLMHLQIPPAFWQEMQVVGLLGESVPVPGVPA